MSMMMEITSATTGRLMKNLDMVVRFAVGGSHAAGFTPSGPVV
jgi:hypothetical protein